MNLHIRFVRNADIEDLVQLSLLAFAPIFVQINQKLGPNIYRLIWPGWKTGQRDGVEMVCIDGEKFIV